MIKNLFAGIILLFCTTILRADTFSFSYSGASGLIASGTLTAVLVGKDYDVTSITGTRGGSAIGNLVWGSFDYNGAASNVLIIYDFGSVWGFIPVTETVHSVGNGYTETTSSLGNTNTSLTSLSISRVPEPAALLLFLVMGLGVWVCARKFSSTISSRRLG